MGVIGYRLSFPRRWGGERLDTINPILSCGKGRRKPDFYPTITPQTVSLQNESGGSLGLSVSCDKGQELFRPIQWGWLSSRYAIQELTLLQRECAHPIPIRSSQQLLDLVPVEGVYRPQVD